MRKILFFCLSLILVQLSSAQITLVRSMEGSIYPHFQYYFPQEGPLDDYCYYATTGSYSIPCTYYDKNFNIIEQTSYVCLNNELTISSTGIVDIHLGPISLPQDYEVYSIRFSQYEFNADDLIEFYIVLHNGNISYGSPEYNNSYCRFIVNSNGAVLSDTLYSIGSISGQHFMIDSMHYFYELTYRDLNYNNYSYVTNIYTCSGPNRPTYVSQVDTVFITQYDTILVNVHDTILVNVHDTVMENLPFYNLSVLSDNPSYGIPVGSGDFPQNCNVEIGAIPIGDNQFLQWSDGNLQNPRSVNIQSDETYVAIFQPSSVPAYSTPEPWRITTSSQGITVEGAEGHPIRLFDTSGRCLQVIADADATTFIPVEIPGMYLLQVDNGSARKIVIP